MQSFLNWYLNTIGHMIPAELSVFLVSMLPLIEERGGFILAGLLKVSLWKTIFLCILGNIAPIPFILFFIKTILDWLKRNHFSRIVDFCEAKVEKNKAQIEKYGFWGLVLFVGIPLPGTGAWTGALVASMLDMENKKSSLAILLGILLAACIMLIPYTFIGVALH